MLSSGYLSVRDGLLGMTAIAPLAAMAWRRGSARPAFAYGSERGGKTVSTRPAWHTARDAWGR
jgi:hypothetical protein